MSIILEYWIRNHWLTDHLSLYLIFLPITEVCSGVCNFHLIIGYTILILPRPDFGSTRGATQVMLCIRLRERTWERTYFAVWYMQHHHAHGSQSFLSIVHNVHSRSTEFLIASPDIMPELADLKIMKANKESDRTRVSVLAVR